MKFQRYTTTGFAGSTALTALHQVVKRTTHDNPHVDLLGQQALEKVLGSNKTKFSNNTLYYATLASDLVSNALFYGVIAKAKKSILAGGLLGAAYGVGTVFLPKVMGLNEEYVAGTPKKKYLTISYYAFGGLVAGVMARYFK